MSLKVVHLAAEIEESDNFHIARLILLLNVASGRNNKPVEGIMKLAKMDFLLRYPNCLVRALEALGKVAETNEIPNEERNTIEAKMIRFRFGPWDKRYRRWVGLLIAKDLAHAYLTGRTVNIKLTDAGKDTATKLSESNDFRPIFNRSKIIVSTVGGFSATKLKDFIYNVFPEIIDMQWGKEIEL